MKLKLILAVIVTVMPGAGYASSSTGGNISWTDDPCIHNCMNCAQWESATCCTICRDPTGGGSGGSGTWVYDSNCHYSE